MTVLTECEIILSVQVRDFAPSESNPHYPCYWLSGQTFRRIRYSFLYLGLLSSVIFSYVNDGGFGDPLNALKAADKKHFVIFFPVDLFSYFPPPC